MPVEFFSTARHKCPVGKRDDRDELTRLRDAERARRVRALRGDLTRREVSAGSGLTEKTVQRAEDPGPGGVLGLRAAKALALFYGVSLDHLLALSWDDVSKPKALPRAAAPKRRAK